MHFCRAKVPLWLTVRPLSGHFEATFLPFLSVLAPFPVSFSLIPQPFRTNNLLANELMYPFECNEIKCRVISPTCLLPLPPFSYLNIVTQKGRSRCCCFQSPDSRGLKRIQTFQRSATAWEQVMLTRLLLPFKLMNKRME